MAVFLGSAIVTILGITQVLEIKHEYLQWLLLTLIGQVIVAVISLFTGTDFFNDTPNFSRTAAPISNQAEKIRSCVETIPCEVSKRDTSKEKGMACPFDTTLYRERPYPVEIRDEIKNSPPIQKAEKQNSYKGLKVTWLTTFETSHDPSPEGNVLLMLLDRGHYPWVNLTANLNEYPELKSANKSAEIWVAGEIMVADEGVIVLEMEHIKLL